MDSLREDTLTEKCCTCGHTRGEHFMPEGLASSRCLVPHCDCFKFVGPEPVAANLRTLP